MRPGRFGDSEFANGDQVRQRLLPQGGQVPNAYIVYDHELDMVADYCDKNNMFNDTIVGCRHLGLNFKSYVKAEREMRRLGFEPNEAIFAALPGGNAGRRISMMPLKAKPKRRCYI